jgi:hypothetical protein
MFIHMQALILIIYHFHFMCIHCIHICICIVQDRRGNTRGRTRGSGRGKSAGGARTGGAQGQGAKRGAARVHRSPA